MPAARSTAPIPLHRVAGAVALLAAATWLALPALAGAGTEASGRQTMVQTSGTPSARPGRVDTDELLALFPSSLAGWGQSMLGKPLPTPMPTVQPQVEAEYRRGDEAARITVASGRNPPQAAPGKPHFARTPGGDARPHAATVSLANGVQITASSRTADAATLETVLRALDLARFEALKPAKR